MLILIGWDWPGYNYRHPPRPQVAQVPQLKYNSVSYWRRSVAGWAPTRTMRLPLAWAPA